MPAIAKILLVFTCMLLVTRLRIHLSVALILGGLALNVWAGCPPGDLFGNLTGAFKTGELWLLLMITSMVIEIGHFMTHGPNAKEIVAATRRWGGRHGRIFSLMAMPAVIGLVPMPAGALFSAPYVEQAGGNDVSAAGKSAINYWFRHIWEFWWPLYPGVIVAMTVFDLEAWRFISSQIFLTPASVAAGYFFLVRAYHKNAKEEEPEPTNIDNRRALFVLLPLAIVVVAAFVTSKPLALAFTEMPVKYRKLLSVLIGLTGALAVILWDDRRRHGSPQGGRGRLFAALLQKRSRNVLMTLTGVLVFKHLMETSGLLPLAGRELVDSGIPVTVAIAALPFVAGMVTGLALGFVGASFPLVVGLMATEGSGLTPLSTLALAYGFGQVGMILSPVHLCVLVTGEYFGASLPSIFRRVLPCALVMLLYSVALHLVLRALSL